MQSRKKKVRKKKMKNDIKYEIIEHIATLSTSESGWSKEVNKVSWNDAEPVIDIRNWNEEHTRCGKGVTMTSEEYEKLKEVI